MIVERNGVGIIVIITRGLVLEVVEKIYLIIVKNVLSRQLNKLGSFFRYAKTAGINGNVLICCV